MTYFNKMSVCVARACVCNSVSEGLIIYSDMIICQQEPPSSEAFAI